MSRKLDTRALRRIDERANSVLRREGEQLPLTRELAVEVRVARDALQLVKENRALRHALDRRTRERDNCLAAIQKVERFTHETSRRVMLKAMVDEGKEV